MSDKKLGFKTIFMFLGYKVKKINFGRLDLKVSSRFYVLGYALKKIVLDPNNKLVVMQGET